ncbi:soma ferritin-like [Branchiostoma floridae]|uniref:Ferritin n=1 Tax=Branchiostoma floridae TaxID=7739 RepID=A0A9J7MPK6_BRAFL|nr:soma ferritin-like [Branchiostoma floridae]XP_035674751.1 soma ferritin-like [Branchiostoma floridae]
MHAMMKTLTFVLFVLQCTLGARREDNQWLISREDAGDPDNQDFARQNFHEDCEAGINKQINLEMFAGYTYRSMASYFNRDDVALKGVADFFRHHSEEELEHAQLLEEFQNKRGGRVVYENLRKPEKDTWGSALEAMQAALTLEKNVNQRLINLHKTAGQHNDMQMQDFLDSHFMTEQVEGIKQIADYITNLKRVGTGLGEYMFDQHTLSGGK